MTICETRLIFDYIIQKLSFIISGGYFRRLEETKRETRKLVSKII